VNCAFYQDPALQGAPAEEYPNFEEYTAPNVWPDKILLPTFRESVEALCTLIIDVAVLVARACDTYAEAKIEGYQRGYLEHVVKTSLTTKARLLHYFPSMSSAEVDGVVNGESNGEKAEGSGPEEDDWCATHLDHGCLTGLTSAMFVDEAEQGASDASSQLDELPSSPDPSAGLYIRSRRNETVKVSIPRDALAFQTGEALEMITRGKFRAVPHFVKGAKTGGKVARNTLAVFTQPNLGEIVDGERGTTFADFARGVVGRNTKG